MKAFFTSFTLVTISLLLVGQITMSSYLRASECSSIMSPIEETGDEDTDEQVELDKLFCQVSLIGGQSVIVKSHQSVYTESHTEPIEEIVPPPPKG